jgi:hypothetical protein
MAAGERVRGHECSRSQSPILASDNGELTQARALGMPVVMIRPSDILNDYRKDPEEDWNVRGLNDYANYFI